MKTFISLTLLFILLFTPSLQAEYTKTRLIIMADMGNEADEEQQMMHLLMYSNMVDLEGLLAVSGIFLRVGAPSYRDHVQPDLLKKLVDGYAKVFDNLKKHDTDWPEPDYLYSIIKGGTNEYGIDAVGDGNSTDASELIEAALLKNDPRPLYFVGNAGTNSLAQALHDLGKTRTQSEMDAITKKIIVFENGAQDNCGAVMVRKYPSIAWFRSCWQTYSYGGPGNGNSVEGPNTWLPL
ncbi:DUF1593 domain-containing protein [Planctomycetota bacterium]